MSRRTTIVNFLVTDRGPLEAGQTTALTIAMGVVLGVLVSLTSVDAGAFVLVGGKPLT